MKNDQRPPAGDKDKVVFGVDLAKKGNSDQTGLMVIVKEGMWVTPEGELIEGYSVVGKVLFGGTE